MLDQIKNYIHESDVVELSEYKTSDKIYHAAYEVENFINVRSNSSNEFDGFDLLNDPTYTGFKIYFHFASTSGLFADEQYSNSALAYLKRIGHTGRYLALKNFIQVFQRLSMQSQWLFKSITGLDEVFTTDLQGVIREHEIELVTFETIDLKVQRLIMMYRDIAFDQSRGVWILPVNLRRFSFSIYVYDNRVFSTSSETAMSFLRTSYKLERLEGNTAGPLTKTTGSDPSNLAHVLFDCGQCEFSINSGKSFFDDVSNNRSEHNNNNLSFIIRKVAFSDLLMVIDASLREEYLSYLSSEKSSNGSTGSTPSQSIMGMTTSGDFSKATSYSREAKKYSRFEQSIKQHITKNALVKNISDNYESLKSTSTDWQTSTAKTTGGRIVEFFSDAAIELATNAAKSIADAAMKNLTKVVLGNVYGYGFDDIAMAARSGNALASRQSYTSTESTTKTLNDKIGMKNLGNIND